MYILPLGRVYAPLGKLAVSGSGSRMSTFIRCRNWFLDGLGGVFLSQ